MNEEVKSRRMTEIAGKIVSGTATPHDEEEYRHLQASYRRDLLDLPAVTRPLSRYDR